MHGGFGEAHSRAHDRRSEIDGEDIPRLKHGAFSFAHAFAPGGVTVSVATALLEPRRVIAR